MDEETKNAVLETAREHQEEETDILEIRGVTIRLLQIPAAIFAEVNDRITEPKIPMWHNAEMERDEENPNDPEYLRAVEETTRKRAEAVMDVCAMFGFELVNGLPENDDWLNILRYAEKRGMLDLSQYNLEDPLEREFVYKRFSIATTGLIEDITRYSQVSTKEIARQKRTFQRPKKR